MDGAKILHVNKYMLHEMYFLDFHLTDKLKSCIEDAKIDYKRYCRALDIDYLIFDRVGKNVCKKQAVSPDAVMQLGFQVSRVGSRKIQFYTVRFINHLIPLSLRAAHKINLTQYKGKFLWTPFN